MEFGGLALGIAVLLIVVFALPRWISHRKAVTESREGDRFSTNLVLVEQNSTSKGLHLQPLNSTEVRLLPQVTDPSLAGETTNTSMSQSREAKLQESSVGSAAKRRGAQNALGSAEETALTYSGASRGYVSRKISRLRSKRAGRIAREQAAGRRRFITAAVTAVLVVAYGGVATFTALSWWWMLLPGVFLAITLTMSFLAGSRSARQNALENTYLAALEAKLRGEEIPEHLEDVLFGKNHLNKRSKKRRVRNEATVGRAESQENQGNKQNSQRNEANSQKNLHHQNDVDGLGDKAHNLSAKTDTANSRGQSESTNARDSWFEVDSQNNAVRVNAPVPNTADNSGHARNSGNNNPKHFGYCSGSSHSGNPGGSSSFNDSDQAGSPDSSRDSNNSGHSGNVAREQAFPAMPALSTPSTPIAEEIVTERRTTSWSVATIPKPTYATKERVKGRAIHIDTDINPLLQSARPDDNVPVPGRPVAVTREQHSERVDIDEAATNFSMEKHSAAEPSLKFNLDAVLEQRRAK